MKILSKRNITLITGRFLHFLLFLCAASILTSCFTGIESTKKIHLSREDKKLTAPTPEEQFMSQIRSSALETWPEGKKFLVTDDKALLIIVPKEGLLPVAPDSIKGKILEFYGVESKINAAGNLTLAILFSDGIFVYEYDTGKDFEEAMAGIKSDQIPMLIDVEMVEQARQLLTGKKLWTRSPLWYDLDANRINGKKFVEVTIIDVTPGNLVFPLNVEFEYNGKEKAFMFMNLGNAENESRSFHNLFSLSDVKKHYPAIEPEIWTLITEGKVKVGMSKEECRLALGNPNEISSGHDYSQTIDIWSYDDGRVLWFEDGRLVRLRQ